MGKQDIIERILSDAKAEAEAIGRDAETRAEDIRDRLLAAVCLYALGGGLIEVLITPLANACPSGSHAASTARQASVFATLVRWLSAPQISKTGRTASIGATNSPSHDVSGRRSARPSARRAAGKAAASASAHSSGVIAS